MKRRKVTDRAADATLLRTASHRRFRWFNRSGPTDRMVWKGSSGGGEKILCLGC